MASDQAQIVTVSASYGAGGSVVAPALAERLGVPFLHRVTTTAGALADEEPCAERLTQEEVHTTPVHRLLASLTHTMPAGPTQSPPPVLLQDEQLRRHTEDRVLRLAADGAGVILGRGAAVVLGKDRGFHVRLDGPAPARAVQGAAIENISAEEARGHLDAADRARAAYVRRLYRTDPGDPSHYHLIIDSTAIPLDAVTEIILRALTAFRAPVTDEKASPGR
jgi:cytidylate kinase